jgi:hypothetical protein
LELVVTSLARQDLSCLALVSETLRNSAERALYLAIHVDAFSDTSCALETLSINSTKALYVKSLGINYNRGIGIKMLQFSTPAFDMLVAALSNTVNLVELRLQLYHADQEVFTSLAELLW